MTNMNTNTEAGILLLSYQSSHLTALHTDKLYVSTPTDQQALCQYAYEPDICYTNKPTTQTQLGRACSLNI